MFIKTKLNIGRFLQNSKIDNIPIVFIKENELDNVDKSDYEIITFNEHDMIDDLIKEITKEMYISYGKIRSVSSITEKNIQKYIVVDFNGDEKEISKDDLIYELLKIIDYEKL